MIPGEEGYSDIFEQHRLSLFFLGGGYRFKSIFFGSGDFLGVTCKNIREWDE